MRFNVLVFIWAFVFAAGLLSAVDVDSCRNITSAGTYVLTSDLTGWNGTTDSPLADYGAKACINIKASNVVLDCQNHAISLLGFGSNEVTGSGPVYGIVLQKNENDHLTGVTVENCLVMYYNAGIMAYNTDRSRFINNTLLYNSEYDPYADWEGAGLMLASEGDNNLIQNNKAFYNGQGFYLTAGQNNTLLRNNASSNMDNGFAADDYIGYCDNNTYTDNYAGNSEDGFGFFGCSYNKLKNNVAEYNSLNGYLVINDILESENNFTANNASYNDNAGFYIVDDNSTLTGNIALGNGRGFVLANGMMAPPIGSLASGHARRGAHGTPAVLPPGPSCYGTCYNVLRNNSAIDNMYGFLLDSVSYNTLDRNYAEDSMEGFSIQFNSEVPEFNVLSNNRAYGTMTGFGIEGGDNNLLVNNSANESMGGFLLSNMIFLDGIDGGATTEVGSKSASLRPADGCGGTCNNTLRNNYAERSEYGYYLTHVGENHLEGNIANDTSYGFYLTDSYFNFLDNNTAVEAYSGFYIMDEMPSSYNNLTNNKARECYYGFYMYQAEYNYLFNNTAYDNNQAGFYLEYSHDNLLYKNTAYNNTQYCEMSSSTREDGMSGGFILYESEYNNLSDNLAYNHMPDCEMIPDATGAKSLFATPAQIPFDFGTGYGFEYSEYNIIQGSEGFNNTFGLVDVDYYSPTLTLNTYMHDNLVEMLYLPYYSEASVDSKGITSEGGEYFNITYSRLGRRGYPASVGIDMTIGSSYNTLLFLNDTPNTEDPPEGYSPFFNKCVQAEMEGGPMDFVQFHWAPYENSYNMSSLKVFRMGEGWNEVEGQGLDLDNHMITLEEYYLDGYYCLFAQTGPEQPSTGQHGSTPSLQVSLDKSCDGNTITVTSGSGPIAGVSVSVDGSSIGTTGDDGTIEYKACGSTVQVHASKNGYMPGDQSFDIISCEQCTKPECASDSDCPDTKVCSEQKCVAVECSCGSVSQHQCREYACCANSDCSENQICMDHSCKVKPGECKAPNCCTADSMCADNQNCMGVTGAPGTQNSPGKCNDITGQCGTVKGHEFVPYGYECGTEPGCPACPQGSTCADHKCISNDLKGPQTGFIGDSAKVQATEGDGVCKDCDIQGTDPTGKPFTGKTGPDGSFELPLTLQGIYKVSLLKGGVVVKTIQINSLPKAPAEEPAKPTATGGLEIFSLIGLLVLLLVVILGVVYWRGTAKKK
jgi:parallel beta-helix repeat protein